jgi:hypothetical protein
MRDRGQSAKNQSRSGRIDHCLSYCVRTLNAEFQDSVKYPRRFHDSDVTLVPDWLHGMTPSALPSSPCHQTVSAS